MMLPFVLIPLVGLAIDETMMYIVKAKLQTAVDGASLAAAQSLSAGLDLSSQAAAATLAADQFIRANMTAGGHGAFWEPTISTTRTAPWLTEKQRPRARARRSRIRTWALYLRDSGRHQQIAQRVAGCQRSSTSSVHATYLASPAER